MKITIKNKKIIDGKENDNLLDLLRKNNIPIKNECGAKGKCGKCKVKILSKSPYKITESDKKHLSEKEINENIRLSCMINLKEDMEIDLVENRDDIKILSDVDKNKLSLNSNIHKKYIELSKPSIEDQRDDFKKLKEGLNIDNLKIDIKNLQQLTPTLKNNDYKITVTTYDEKIIHIQGGDRSKYFYGLALDLGTTTLALYLIDLHKGQVIDILSGVNSQRSYGSDVISRINYTMENDQGLEILSYCITKQINEMIKKISYKNNISVDEIYNIAVVGNTTMIHLLTKTPVKNIALAPFIPTFTDNFECKAKDINIDINGVLSLPPGNSAYVGSDISSGILSSKMCENEKYSLLLDIGTNGEIALGNKEKVFTCATAAGPAFEGANIKYGVGGIEGAISSIDLNNDKIYETINNKTPCGICGSGVLDITSELLKHNIIDESGKFYDCDEINNKKLKDKIDEEENLKEFIIYKDNDKKVAFTQKDIREVQLAKASICAGIKVLLKESNLTYDKIENVYIGGGFGNFMNVKSAIKIGMIPYELKDKIKSIGNCAGKGCIEYLINMEKRREIKKIVNKCIYIELSKNKDFQEFYIDSISFE